MDVQGPDHQPNAANGGGPLSAHSHQRVLKELDAALPAGATDSPADRDENRQATRELFESLDPRDPAEAQLAAIAIAAAQSAMDNFARAARPGVADEAAIRLRSSALTAGRTYAAALRTLRKRAPEPAATRAGGRTQAGTRRGPAATSQRAPSGPRRVPAARPVRSTDRNLPDRADDAGATARDPRLAARRGAGGRRDRRGGGHDRGAGGP